jgi:hypothetical protein
MCFLTLARFWLWHTLADDAMTSEWPTAKEILCYDLIEFPRYWPISDGWGRLDISPGKIGSVFFFPNLNFSPIKVRPRILMAPLNVGTRTYLYADVVILAGHVEKCSDNGIQFVGPCRTVTHRTWYQQI